MTEKKAEECYWYVDCGGDYYDTSCNYSFTFNDGNCEENQFKFCPKCGGTITEVDDSPEEDG